MVRYRNLIGNSGVHSYEFLDNAIKVMFCDGKIYLYDYFKAGASNIERMKFLARNGQGLNTFINQEVRKLYSSKVN